MNREIFDLIVDQRKSEKAHQVSLHEWIQNEMLHIKRIHFLDIDCCYLFTDTCSVQGNREYYTLEAAFFTRKPVVEDASFRWWPCDEERSGKLQINSYTRTVEFYSKYYTQKDVKAAFDFALSVLRCHRIRHIANFRQVHICVDCHSSIQTVPETHFVGNVKIFPLCKFCFNNLNKKEPELNHSFEEYKHVDRSAASTRRDVYLIHAKGTRHYKIGIARNVKSRICSIKTGSPYEIVCIANKVFDCASTKEKELHSKYAGKRKNGEWFEFEESDIAEIVMELS
jgi:hypothetical protein